MKPDRGGSAANTAPLRRSPAADGFTLIEVAFAMTILAVGLLALQALTIAAVRSGALAERNTRAVMLAAGYLEDSVEELRRSRMPAPFTCTLANGDQIERGAEETSVPGVVAVTVRVTPAPSASAPPAFTLASHGYSPSGFAPADVGFACP